MRSLTEKGIEALRRGSFLLKGMVKPGIATAQQWKWDGTDGEDLSSLLPLFDLLRVNLLHIEDLSLSSLPSSFPQLLFWDKEKKKKEMM